MCRSVTQWWVTESSGLRAQLPSDSTSANPVARVPVRHGQHHVSYLPFSVDQRSVAASHVRELALPTRKSQSASSNSQRTSRSKIAFGSIASLLFIWPQRRHPNRPHHRGNQLQLRLHHIKIHEPACSQRACEQSPGPWVIQAARNMQIVTTDGIRAAYSDPS